LIDGGPPGVTVEITVLGLVRVESAVAEQYADTVSAEEVDAAVQGWVRGLGGFGGDSPMG
jgi:hypothetical protein